MVDDEMDADFAHLT